MSAILSARGASAKLIDWMTREEDYFQLLISQPIWDEYRTVADWLIPDSKQLEKERILHVLFTQAEWIEPAIRLNVCTDTSDNRFLECAVAGGADYLVTKNIRHFPPQGICRGKNCSYSRVFASAGTDCKDLNSNSIRVMLSTKVAGQLGNKSILRRE
jgi:putative PIN family toxin of toxin-antitoxin system